MQKRDRTGEVYGFVTVIARAGDDPAGYPLWRVRCVCGQERITRCDFTRGREPRTHYACKRARWDQRNAAES
jgi:hypothetical protein